MSNGRKGGTPSSEEKASPRLKFVVIALICIMGLGFSMVMEIPGSLEKIIMNQMKISREEFDLHYHLAYWFCTFSWFGGFIMDRNIEMKIATIVFIAITCIGNTLYVIGCIAQIYWLMLAGWLFTALGVEAGCIAVNCWVMRWFPLKMTNTVFALTKTLPLLGTPLILKTSERIMAYFSAIISRQHALSITTTLDMLIILVPLASSIALALISKIKIINGTVMEQKPTIKSTDLFKFPPRLWILAGTANIFFSSCILFLRLNILRDKYQLSKMKEEVLFNSYRIGSCIMAPIIGMIVDWKGRNLTYITLSVLGGLIAHFAFAFTITDPFYPMLLLSCSYSLLVGSYWPLYKQLVKQHEICTAFGIDNSIMMLFCAIGNLITTSLIDLGSNAVELFYLTLMTIAVVGIAVLWALDYKMGGDFNKPTLKRTRSRRMSNGSRGERKPQKLPQAERKRKSITNLQRIKSSSTEELIKLRRKRIEAENKLLYKNQRRRRQMDRTYDRNRTKSSDVLL